MQIKKVLAATVAVPLIVAAIAGCVAVALVILGTFVEIPHFNPREGYLGTRFIAGLLFTLADQGLAAVAIAIVALIWFIYAFLGVGALSFIVMLANLLWVVPKRNRKSHAITSATRPQNSDGSR